MEMLPLCWSAYKGEAKNTAVIVTWEVLDSLFFPHPFPGQNLLPTELQHSDGYAQLAVHLLLDVNSEKGTKFLHVLCFVKVCYIKIVFL